MKEQLEKLKADLREFIALSKMITPGKWEQHKAPHLNRGGDGPTSIVFQCHYRNDAAFIARSRNISPAMAECLLVAVEGLKMVAGSEISADAHEACNHPSDAWEKLDQIINLWNLK